MSGDGTLGIGFLGYGFIGRVHAYAHASLPFFYRSRGISTTLVGVCTSRAETAVTAVEEGAFRFGTTDPDELIAHPDIDVVHICSPNDSHRDYAVAALRHGKHVYCEKPLARTLAEARAMRDAAVESGLVHQVAFQYRFVPALLRAKQLIDAGRLGRVLSFRAQYLHSGYTDPDRPMSWRLDLDRSGGGALYDLGSHAIDLVRWLLGDVRRVCARLHTFTTSRPVTRRATKRVPVRVDDLALLQIETTDGALGTLEASRVATGTVDDLVIELHGTDGAIRFNLMDANWLDVFDAKAEDVPIGGNRGYTRVQTLQSYPAPAVFPPARVPPGWLRFHIASLHDFISNVAEGRAGAPSFEDGYAVQAVLDAAQRSNDAGTWVDVTPDP